MTESHAESSPNIEERSFRDLLQSMIGEVFTVANPEAYEDTGLGPTIRSEIYRMKLIGMGQDYLITVRQFTHGAGKHAVKEAAREYIPLSQVKCISLLHDQRVLHL